MIDPQKCRNPRRDGAGKLPGEGPDWSPTSDIFGEGHDTAESAGVASAAYVVVVAFARSRRAYLTLAAAEAAVARARVQGRPATLQLLRCAPVGGDAL